MERNVQCAVKFFSGKLFFQFDDFFVFIIVKIVCLYPKRKFFKSDIGSICAVGIRVVLFFYVSCRRQKFHDYASDLRLFSRRGLFSKV